MHRGIGAMLTGVALSLSISHAFGQATYNDLDVPYYFNADRASNALPFCVNPDKAKGKIEPLKTPYLTDAYNKDDCCKYTITPVETTDSHICIAGSCSSAGGYNCAATEHITIRDYSPSVTGQSSTPRQMSFSVNADEGKGENDGCIAPTTTKGTLRYEQLYYPQNQPDGSPNPYNQDHCCTYQAQITTPLIPGPGEPICARFNCTSNEGYNCAGTVELHVREYPP